MECPNCHRRVSPHSRRCAACGGIIPPGQHLLEQSGLVESAGAAPGMVSNPDLWRLATLGDRWIAVTLDALVLLSTFVVVDTWAFSRWGISAGSEFNLTTASLLLAGSLDCLIFFVYVWLLEAGFGCTLGKAMVGIRVVKHTERGALVASAIRNALRLVDGIAFYGVGALVASCSRLRQRLGDICAGTIVVEEEFHPGIRMLALVLWLGALVGAAWALPRVHSDNTVPPRYLNQIVVQVGHTENSAYIRAARLRIDVQFAPITAIGQSVRAQGSQ